MKRNKSILIICCTIITLAILSFFLFRNAILNSYIQKTSDTFKTKYGARLVIGKSEFSGISTINIAGIFIIPENNDTFFRIDSLSASFRISSLFSGRPTIQSIASTGGKIAFIERDSLHNNYSFLFRLSSTSKKQEKGATGFSSLLGKAVNGLFEKIPADVVLNNYSAQYKSPFLHSSIVIPLLKFHEKALVSSLHISENDTISHWQLAGNISRREKNMQLMVYRNKNDSLSRVPLVKPLLGLYATADTVQIQLSGYREENDFVSLKAGVTIAGFRVKHWRISKKEVKISSAKANVSLQVGRDYIQADSSSSFMVNNILFHPYLKYTHNPGKTLTFRANMPYAPSSAFFKSLPDALFPNTSELEAKGELAYRMSLTIDSRQIDSLDFTSLLTARNFEIIKYGKTNLSRMNGDFNYVAYEKGYAVDTLSISAGSRDFTPISEISPYLRASVMTSEDGNFYYHKGFNLEMFRRAIAINLNEKRFVRGGSTISMQLVKNVFLNRDKTISRKLEEALIVWLIEQNRLTSKERMYEVYLNIIEWGPRVYGITQASEFYFNKKPSDLTLEESIFLAMIVPFPKWFKYQFDETGKLRESSNVYYQLLAGHLVKKGVMTEEQKLNLKADVKITGRAKAFLKIKEEGDLPEGILLEDINP